jgi:hypothetical protein
MLVLRHNAFRSRRGAWQAGAGWTAAFPFVETSRVRRRELTTIIRNCPGCPAYRGQFPMIVQCRLACRVWGPGILRIRFEDLAEAGSQTTRAIVSFLGASGPDGDTAPLQDNQAGPESGRPARPEPDLPVDLIPPAVLTRANDLLRHSVTRPCPSERSSYGQRVKSRRQFYI